MQVRHARSGYLL